MLLELAEGGSEIHCDAPAAVPEAALAIQKEVIVSTTKGLAWYLFLDDPADYQEILEQVLTLTDYADCERSFRIGLNRILRFNPWVPQNQIDLDLRENDPGFEEHVSDSWREAYKNALADVMQKILRP